MKTLNIFTLAVILMAAGVTYAISQENGSTTEDHGAMINDQGNMMEDNATMMMEEGNMMMDNEMMNETMGQGDQTMTEEATGAGNAEGAAK